jgi:hypothetical protein
MEGRGGSRSEAWFAPALFVSASKATVPVRPRLKPRAKDADPIEVEWRAAEPMLRSGLVAMQCGATVPIEIVD